MGRLVDVDEAAEYAGVTTRTIFVWLKRHKLTRHTMRHRTMVDLEEIDLMNTCEHAVPLNALPMMLRRMELLERKVEFLLYSTGGQEMAIDLSKEELVAIYDTVQLLIRKDKYTVDEIDEIEKVLSNISESALEVLLEAKDDPQPWVPFFRLGYKVQRYLRQKGNFDTHIYAQEMHRKIAKHRETLRDLALLFIEADTDGVARYRLMEELGPLACLESEVLRRLSMRAPKLSKVWKDPTQDMKQIYDFIRGADSEIANVWMAIRKLREIADQLEMDASN